MKKLAIPAAVGLLGLLIVGAQSTSAAATGTASPAPVATNPADLTKDTIGFDAPAQAADQAILTYLQGNPDLNGGFVTQGPTDVTIALMPSVRASADLGSLVKAAQALGVNVKYSTAAHSLTELNADAAKVCTGSAFNTCGVDMQTDSVKLTAANAIPALDQYGSAVTVAVTPGLAHITADSGRFDDTAPFNGADAIDWCDTSTCHYCSDGFYMQDAAGNPYAITAGHCYNPGSTGTTTYSAHTFSPLYPGTHSMGVEYFTQFQSSAYCNAPTHTCIDAAIIGSSTYSSKDWIGPQITTTKQTVTSASNVVAGTYLYPDGANTGQGALSIVDGAVGCINIYDDNVPYLICDVVQAHGVGSGQTIIGGDSGGPVIGPDGAGGLVGVGVINGGNGTDWYYTSLPSILTSWGSHLN